jgi:hypothetical protein
MTFNSNMESYFDYANLRVEYRFGPVFPSVR